MRLAQLSYFACMAQCEWCHKLIQILLKKSIKLQSPLCFWQLFSRMMSESNLIFPWKNSKIFATTLETSKYKEFAKLYYYIERRGSRKLGNFFKLSPSSTSSQKLTGWNLWNYVKLCCWPFHFKWKFHELEFRQQWTGWRTLIQSKQPPSIFWTFQTLTIERSNQLPDGQYFCH